MTPRSKEQFAEMGQQSRHLIVEAALELFATNGFHATTIRMIAKKAGISVGLMYNYFRSKEELLREINRQGMIHATADFGEGIDWENPPDLAVLLAALFEFLQKNLKIARLYLMILMQPEALESCKEDADQVFKHLEGYFEMYFRQRGAEDPVLKAQMIQSIVLGVITQLLMGKDPELLDRVQTELIKKFS